MKVPPPTIISPTVIQRSPGDGHGSSMVRVPDNIGPALARLGKSIALSVEILATVGETIADENPDIRGDMLQSCRESSFVRFCLSTYASAAYTPLAPQHPVPLQSDGPTLSPTPPLPLPSFFSVKYGLLAWCSPLSPDKAYKQLDGHTWYKMPHPCSSFMSLPSFN